MLTWSFIYVLYVISEWVIRLTMLVWVPQKRSPAAARTWLMFIFLLPWPGLIVYAVIGRVYWPKRRLELQAKASARVRETQFQWGSFLEKLRPEIPEVLQPTVTLARNLGEFNVVGQNAVELLDEYNASIARLVADINEAHNHVHLEYYIFENDETGRCVTDALLRAAGRGVKCRVLMDAVGGRSGLKAFAPELQAAGVEVTALLPVGLFRRKAARLDLRNHRKIVIIDGRIGYIGSQNIINARVNATIIHEELVARIQGPVVAQMQVVFLADRYFETETRLDEVELFPDPEQCGDSPAQLIPGGPGYRYSNAEELLVSLIHDARRRVVITTPYFVPDAPFIQAMETAVLSGVEVHLVVSRQADHLLVSLAQQSYYEALLEAGVKIHLYRPYFLHAKHVTVDDSLAFVGSTNIDLRSFGLDAEISLLIYDPAVVAKLRVIQDRYFANSDLLTMEQWNRRPWSLQIAQNTARLADSLL
jgi:cardiolipin synthase